MRYVLLIGALVVVAVIATQLGSSSPRSAAPPPTPASAAAAPGGPVRPRQPPREDMPRRPADEPDPLRPSPAQRRVIAEKARGAERPGMTAFRAFSDLYVDQNLDFARRQAEAEGLTLDQVRDLTEFGLLVLSTQRVPDVEEILGRALSEEQREGLSSLMMSANAEFKEKMRALVAAGASLDERWALIRQTRAEYLADFYVTTGMNEALLDDLLAGNMGLPGAPAGTALPTGASPPEPLDHELQPAPRPR